MFVKSVPILFALLATCFAQEGNIIGTFPDKAIQAICKNGVYHASENGKAHGRPFREMYQHVCAGKPWTCYGNDPMFSCGPGAYCSEDIEGNPSCWKNGECSNFLSCSSNSDCGEDEACIPDTCCDNLSKCLSIFEAPHCNR